MDDVLLTLVMPPDVARRIEDLLLEHAELVPGFGSTQIAGHGSAVHLAEPAELVSGHAPRVQIQIVGKLPAMHAVLDILRQQFPHANVFYWIAPALEVGRIA
ncbi:MAG: DUF3240 family protein [Rhodocyclaceae bacterium]|nr:DUF3240 family protein [Rhodocyclaceae bacterium]MBX3669710.1 DUF3240 family protein [Rhodocyclaceae bacterium]